MSMIGNYLRLSANDLDILLAEPERLPEVLYPEEDAASGKKFLDVDKAWHAIHFLLNDDPWAGEYPLRNAVLGGAPASDEDMGYGPARYLTVEEVRALSIALARVSRAELLRRYRASELNAAGVYHQSWSDSPEDRDYVGSNYEALVDFFGAAGRNSEAVIVWLS